MLLLFPLFIFNFRCCCSYLLLLLLLLVLLIVVIVSHLSQVTSIRFWATPSLPWSFPGPFLHQSRAPIPTPSSKEYAESQGKTLVVYDTNRKLHGGGVMQSLTWTTSIEHYWRDGEKAMSTSYVRMVEVKPRICTADLLPAFTKVVTHTHTHVLSNIACCISTALLTKECYPIVFQKRHASPCVSSINHVAAVAVVIRAGIPYLLKLI